MDITRMQQISLAEGHVEDFIERTVEGSDSTVADQAARLHAAWLIVVSGLKELRQENLDLANKLILAKSALG